MSSPIALAFSGGLDTSFCVPYLKEETGRDVWTVTVDTGGFSADELEEVEARSKTLGAAGHTTVDARADLWERALSYLVKGNVLRGGVYPLCVGPERVVQAQALVGAAREIGATAVAHGSTGAGNDQVRFDTALRLLAGQTASGRGGAASDGTGGAEIEVMAPIRTLGLTREASAAYLAERGVHVDPATTDYSVNRGLWGTTIGGKETHRTDGVLPESAWPDTASPDAAPPAGREVAVQFERGVPVALDGEAMAPVALVEALGRIGAEHGVGRGVHVGDTILGIKGRVAFEAPAALVLIDAHRELEKVVLTKLQLVQKAALGDLYGALMHEGLYFDPVMRDLEAFLDSSQRRVSGVATVALRQGAHRVRGVSSPHSLFDTGVATYGEETALWDGRDAEGFTRIYGLQSLLAAAATSDE
ncbi:argininosuccinate synthase [Rubrivirga sp. S365]|uniref:argininosuccinate synthase n=1 Tax=Rubrivirga litoralis TaxID=3075598 RepID=A0ABU3BP90_9BACT|nr:MULTISPECIES: argininosuccinate synthase [unclassified Rubrivirga]MDT0631109.1 argininosuccinate synthase [Rubrivirga sp. F394]MDT7855378.1 argininosuccinate synthase [Rubrivirga sp. S365]